MLKDLIEDRRKKLKEIVKSGADPYPARVTRTHLIAGVRDNFNSLAKTKKRVTILGRIISVRDQGKVIFLDLEDQSGKIQIILKKDTLKDFDFEKSVLDRGDFAETSGTLFVTKKGEQSIEAKFFRIIAKALRPLPTEWYGIEDEELRLRERYLEFTLHPAARDVFMKKAIFWNSFREYLRNEGFLEVETPVLEHTPGGAETTPFKTHHNALDTDFFLRISLELPLKKLLAGGFERVFEIGRIFRNEGIDREHLQDYTQLEFYWAYHDYHDLMKFTEKLYKQVIKTTTGTLATMYGDKKINWNKKWTTVKYVDVFKKYNKLDPIKATEGELMKRARAVGYAPRKGVSRGRLIDGIYKRTVRPHLQNPCFLINPPASVEPLAKRKEGNPDVVERFQIVAAGTELGKGFSELNDPLDQRKRFEDQERARAAGDTEAERLDEEFLTAMEYGMPPAAGFGASERLFAVLMDKPVRETVIFPLMRPKNSTLPVVDTSSGITHGMATIDDFKKLDLRVGKIMSAKRIEGSDKLIKMEIDFGAEKRQILAGIGIAYNPKALVGKELIAIVNLKTRMLMGIESQGMILAVLTADGPIILKPEYEVPPGAIVH